MPIELYVIITTVAMMVLAPIAGLAKKFSVQIAATLLFTAVLTAPAWWPL